MVLLPLCACNAYVCRHTRLAGRACVYTQRALHWLQSPVCMCLGSAPANDALPLGLALASRPSWRRGVRPNPYTLNPTWLTLHPEPWEPRRQADAEVRDKVLAMVEDYARALRPPEFQASYENLLVRYRGAVWRGYRRGCVCWRRGGTAKLLTLHPAWGRMQMQPPTSFGSVMWRPTQMIPQPRPPSFARVP